MASSLRRRGAAALALATASGLTLAASAPAGAAKTAAPAYYQGVTSANVLGVALHLPAALPALPGLPKDLALNLIGVTGNAVHNTLGTGAATTSTAVSTLANGSLVDALPAQLGLKKTLKATLAGQNSVSATSFETPAALDPIAHLRVGFLKADAHQLTNSASALLNDGTVGKLGDLLNTTSAGAAALSQLQSTLQNLKVPATGQTITDTLNGALDQVTSALGAAPAGSTVADTLTQVQTALNTVLDQVNNIIANVGDTAVLKVSALTASQSIAPTDGAAQATALSNLVNLDVLNGLLTVKGFTSQATAVANGKPGGAKATFSGHEPIVAVGTPVLSATLSDAGLALQGVPGLGSQVNDALAQVQSALNSLLATLGVHLNFVPGHVVRQDANGKFASAVGPEYDVVVTNPVDSSALVEVGLGHGTAASVSAAQATKHVTLPNPQQGALPHTGANLPLLAGGGLALLVGAAYLRRRVLS